MSTSKARKEKKFFTSEDTQIFVEEYVINYFIRASLSTYENSMIKLNV